MAEARSFVEGVTGPGEVHVSLAGQMLTGFTEDEPVTTSATDATGLQQREAAATRKRTLAEMGSSMAMSGSREDSSGTESSSEFIPSIAERRARRQSTSRQSREFLGNEDALYQTGDVVWAKFVDYSWWPGTVEWEDDYDGGYPVPVPVRWFGADQNTVQPVPRHKVTAFDLSVRAILEAEDPPAAADMPEFEAVLSEAQTALDKLQRLKAANKKRRKPKKSAKYSKSKRASRSLRGGDSDYDVREDGYVDSDEGSEYRVSDERLAGRRASASGKVADGKDATGGKRRKSSGKTRGQLQAAARAEVDESESLESEPVTGTDASSAVKAQSVEKRKMPTRLSLGSLLKTLPLSTSVSASMAPLSSAEADGSGDVKMSDATVVEDTAADALAAPNTDKEETELRTEATELKPFSLIELAHNCECVSVGMDASQMTSEWVAAVLAASKCEASAKTEEAISKVDCDGDTVIKAETEPIDEKPKTETETENDKTVETLQVKSEEETEEIRRELEALMKATTQCIEVSGPRTAERRAEWMRPATGGLPPDEVMRWFREYVSGDESMQTRFLKGVSFEEVSMRGVNRRAAVSWMSPSRGGGRSRGRGRGHAFGGGHLSAVPMKRRRTNEGLSEGPPPHWLPPPPHGFGYPPPHHFMGQPPPGFGHGFGAMPPPPGHGPSGEGPMAGPPPHHMWHPQPHCFPPPLRAAFPPLADAKAEECDGSEEKASAIEAKSVDSQPSAEVRAADCMSSATLRKASPRTWQPPTLVAPPVSARSSKSTAASSAKGRDLVVDKVEPEAAVA